MKKYRTILICSLVAIILLFGGIAIQAGYIYHLKKDMYNQQIWITLDEKSLGYTQAALAESLHQPLNEGMTKYLANKWWEKHSTDRAITKMVEDHLYEMENTSK